MYLQFLELDYMPNPPRGCSHLFGYAAIKPFLEVNHLMGIIRAHQCKDEVSFTTLCNNMQTIAPFRESVMSTLTTGRSLSPFLTSQPFSQLPIIVVPMATRGLSWFSQAIVLK